MRTILACVIIALLYVGSIQASTLTARLVSVQDAADPALWHVAIQVQSSNTTAGNADGGVSSFYFDVLSDGHGKSAPVPFVPPNPGYNKVRTVFDPVITGGGFATFPPTPRDAIPADNAGNAKYDADGDFDAVFGGFFDSGNFGNTTVGKNGFQTIATEDWTVPVGQRDFLSLVIVGPEYYDFNFFGLNKSGVPFQVPYSQLSVAQGDFIGVPEPTSLALTGFGCIALFALKPLRRSATF
jgi:hypothetical protein